jgi:hypothetical protein
VTLSGRKFGNYVLILALTGTLFLVVGPRSVQATGCHVPERPVLGRFLFLERSHETGLSPTNSRAAFAPPAIMPVPCQGETPTLPSVTSSLLITDLAPGLMLDPLVPGQNVVNESPAQIPCPIASRLDRPPRRGFALRLTPA